MRTRRFFNMYLTTTVSVMLVLFLVGLETVLLLSARDLIRHVKENVALTLVVNDDADSAELARLENLLTIAPFVKEHTYVSKEEALEEHIASLGENPADFLGYNPLKASVEVKLVADYARTDSISDIERRLSVFPCINRVVYQKQVVNMLDRNVGSISLILIGVALLLLFVTVALIVNTIRLHVYSKRFLINTMKLVGATPHVIKAPIVRKNVLMGLWAGILACVLLVLAFWYCRERLGVGIMLLTWQNCVVVVAVVIGCGLLLTFFASLFAVNRYIRMKTNDLYFI